MQRFASAKQMLKLLLLLLPSLVAMFFIGYSCALKEYLPGQTSSFAASAPLPALPSKIPSVPSAAPSAPPDVSSQPVSSQAPQSAEPQLVTYDKAGNYVTVRTLNDVEVLTGGILLQNKTIQGNLTVRVGESGAVVTIRDTTIDGVLYIQGGGAYQIQLENVHANDILVYSEPEYVRIIAKGDTKLVRTQVFTPAILEEQALLSEGFEDVYVQPDAGYIQLPLVLENTEIAHLYLDQYTQLTLYGSAHVQTVYNKDLLISSQ